MDKKKRNFLQHPAFMPLLYSVERLTVIQQHDWLPGLTLERQL